MKARENQTATTGDAIWNVAIPVPLRKHFAYEVTGPAEAGVRVLVQFGRRRLTGYLLETADPDLQAGTTVQKTMAPSKALYSQASKDTIPRSWLPAVLSADNISGICRRTILPIPDAH